MRNMKFIVNVVLAVSSIAAFGQESARTVQYHSQDIVAIRAKVKYTTLIEVPHDREDHGSRHGRQGFLDCRCGRQLLLCASGETRHQLQLESDYGQGKHLQLHPAGHFRIFGRAGPEGDRRTRRPLCDCGRERPRAVRACRAARTVETAGCRSAIARRAGGGRVQEQLSDATQV